jgi:hypothetical protein
MPSIKSQSRLPAEAGFVFETFKNIVAARKK